MEEILLTTDPSSSVTGTCLRCGAPWTGHPGGRPRKWCSVVCRRAAYEERRAAARGAIAVREVERVKPVEHDLTECTRRASLSPAACRRLVKALSDAGEIVDGSDPRWDTVRNELFVLVRSMVQERREYGYGRR